MSFMKKVSRYTITTFILFFFLLVKNDSVYAYNNIDEYINARGYTTGTYVDNSGKIYWMTKGHTSSGTMGFSSVGLVVRYKSYAVEFLEPDNEGKKTSIQWNNDQYIHILGNKKYNGDTYCLYYIDKGDIIDAFIKRYPEVDFKNELIYSSTNDTQKITLKIDSIMTHWVKDSNGNKVSQCGTLYTNNYQVLTTSTGINNNIQKTLNDMKAYYYRVTGSMADFSTYYNMQAEIYKYKPNDVKIEAMKPTVAHNSNNKYYKKYYTTYNGNTYNCDIYWVKADTPIEIKLEAKVTDKNGNANSNATLQPNWTKLRQYSGSYNSTSVFALGEGYYKNVSATDQFPRSIWNANSELFTSGYALSNNNVYMYRLGYDKLYTFITVKLKKGNTPRFYNTATVESSSDQNVMNRVEIASHTSSEALYLYPDGTAPTITIKGYKNIVQGGTTITTSTDISNWQNKDITVNVSGADTESGVKNCYIMNGSSGATQKKLTTEGKHSVIVYAQDNVGNSKTETTTVKIDKTKPTVEVVDEEALDGYFTGSKTVKFKINDNLSGIKRIHLYTINSSSTVTLKNIDVSDEEILNQELEYTFNETTKFFITVWDYAGNGYTYDNWVKIDITPPYIENVDTVYGWQNHSLTITPKIKDDISGVATFKFLDENNNELETEEREATDDRLEVKVKDLHFTDEQDTIYKVEMTDYAGNTGFFEFQVKIDKTQPVIDGACLVEDSTYDYRGEKVYYIPNGNVDVFSSDPKTTHESFVNEIASGMARLELKDETGVVYGVYSVENGGLLDAYNDIYSIIYDIGENSQKFWDLLATDRAGNYRQIKVVSNRAILASYVTIIPIENYE